MSTQKVFLPGSYYATEVTRTTFLLSGASIAISSNVATVTLASHLLATGDYVTFSGVTGATGLNGATWGPVTVASSSSYTFPCNATGTPAGTIVQEKLYFFAAGTWAVNAGVNGNVEYNPDGLLGANSGYGGAVKGNCIANGTADTWRKLIVGSATVGGGTFTTDGFSIRFRDMGTTATSYFSKVS